MLARGSLLLRACGLSLMPCTEPASHCALTSTNFATVKQQSRIRPGSQEDGSCVQGSFVMQGSYELTLKLASSSWGTWARCLCTVSIQGGDIHFLLNMAAMKMSLTGTFAPSASPLLRSPAKLPGERLRVPNHVGLDSHQAGLSQRPHICFRHEATAT